MIANHFLYVGSLTEKETVMGPDTREMEKILTTLHWFDEERDHDVILVWDSVNFSCLGNLTTSINQSSRKKALTAVSLAVGNEKRMFREFCAPCDHRGDKRGVEGFFLSTAQDRAVTGRV